MPRGALMSAIAVTALMLVPVAALAKTAPIDVTHSSVTCNTVSGILSFKPSLSASGGLRSTVVKLKGALADCTIQPNPLIGAFTATGKFTGSFTGTTNDCGAFFSTPGDPSLTGPLTVKWKPDQAPIVPTSTTMTVTNTSGNFTFSSSWSTQYQQVNIDVDLSSVTGAFLPVPALTTAGLFLIPIEDVNSINAGCSSPQGAEEAPLRLRPVLFQLSAGLASWFQLGMVADAASNTLIEA